MLWPYNSFTCRPSEPSASPRSPRARSHDLQRVGASTIMSNSNMARTLLLDGAHRAARSQADGYDEAARVSEVRHCARHAQARPPFASILASKLVVGRGEVEGYPRP